MRCFDTRFVFFNFSMFVEKVSTGAPPCVVINHVSWCVEMEPPQTISQIEIPSHCKSFCGPFPNTFGVLGVPKHRASSKIFPSRIEIPNWATQVGCFWHLNLQHNTESYAFMHLCFLSSLTACSSHLRPTSTLAVLLLHSRLCGAGWSDATPQSQPAGESKAMPWRVMIVANRQGKLVTMMPLSGFTKLNFPETS